MRTPYRPEETEPFWPKHMWYHLIATLVILSVVAGLALLLVRSVDQDTQPIYTSPVPQPDWLFLLIFQPIRFLRGLPDWVGLVLLPLLLIIGLALLPLLDRSRTRLRSIKWGVILSTLLITAVLVIVTGRSGSTSPLWGCQTCHKPGFGQTFGKAPQLIGEFSTGLDNKWLGIHYQYPQYWWMMDVEPPRW